MIYYTNRLDYTDYKIKCLTRMTKCFYNNKNISI